MAKPSTYAEWAAEVERLERHLYRIESIVMQGRHGETVDGLLDTIGLVELEIQEWITG